MGPRVFVIGGLIALTTGCEEEVDATLAVQAYLSNLEGAVDRATTLRNLIDDLPLPSTLDATKAHIRSAAPARFSPAGCLHVSEGALLRDSPADSMIVRAVGCRDAVGPGGALTDQRLVLATVQPGGAGETLLGLQEYTPGATTQARLTEGEGGRTLVLVSGHMDPQGRWTSSTLELRIGWVPGGSCFTLDGDALPTEGAYVTQHRLRFQGLRVCREGCYTQGRALFEYPRPYVYGTPPGTSTGELQFRADGKVAWSLEGASGVVEARCN